MAIQRINKAHIVCPIDIRESILTDIQNLACLELISGSDQFYETESSQAYDSLCKINYIAKFLSDYRQKESLWTTLKEGLPVFDRKKLTEIESSIDIESDYKNIREYDKTLKEIMTRLSDIERQMTEYKGLENIDLLSADMKSDHIELKLIKYDPHILAAFDNCEFVYIESFENSALLLIYLKNDEAKFKEIQKNLELRTIELPDNETIIEFITELEKEKIQLLEKRDLLKDQILSDFQNKFQEYDVLGDLYTNKYELHTKLNAVKTTRYLSIISGWIPDSSKETLKKTLQKRYEDVFIEFEAASKEDNPPVLLKNNNINKPFELVTNLYGTAQYGWIDPTPVIAPFFTIFFGICLTDAGYGIIMALLCFWALKKFSLNAGTKDFLIIMLWGSFASVVAGALTGGWFGNALSGFSVLNRLRILNPMENPDYFMYFSVGLGYLHVILGVIISIVKNLKSSEYKTAIFEEIPWVLILLSSPMCFIGTSFSKTVALYLVLFGLACVLLLSGHEKKNIFSRLISGLGNIYGGTDYLKDMISYSRLFALGMGTGILAMAVNEIAVLASAMRVFGLPLGYLLMIAIFLAGHVFNIVMSVLSAYIHTSRLQYVEFFKWFFKGGGSAFNPLVFKRRRFILGD